MKKQYVAVVFLLCFFVWAVVIDHAVLPSTNNLRERTGTYSRYTVKEWSQGGKFNLLKDQILIYAHVKDHEEFYYLDYTPYFEQALRNIQPGTRIQLRYAQRFPKVWKKQLYDVKVDGRSVMWFNPAQLKEKQKFVWKFSGIMAGAFALLAVLGMINKPRRK